MFVQSVIEGLKAILNWHILLGMVAVSVATVGFMILIGVLMTSRDESTGGIKAGAGCLLYGFGGPVIQALSVGFFILLLLPALLADRGFTPGPIVAALSGSLIKMSLFGLGATLLICFIPFVGQVIANTPGVVTFMIGIFVIKPLISQFFSAVTGEKIPAEVFPGFLACVGYVLIGLILCSVLLVVLALIRDQVKRRTDPLGYMLQKHSGDSPGLQWVALMLGAVFGLIPLLMYAKYVALALRALNIGTKV